MSSMVVTGKQFNTALEEINASYAAQNKRIESLVKRVMELEEATKEPVKPKTAAQKKKDKEAQEAALESLGDIANR